MWEGLQARETAHTHMKPCRTMKSRGGEGGPGAEKMARTAKNQLTATATTKESSPVISRVNKHQLVIVILLLPGRQALVPLSGIFVDSMITTLKSSKEKSQQFFASFLHSFHSPLVGAFGLFFPGFYTMFPL